MNPGTLLRSDGEGASGFGTGESRAATDRLLAGLRADGWRPAGWGRFLLRSLRRSAHEAALHPRALAELTLLHGGFALLAGRRRARWTVLGWVLTGTHLGLLEGRRGLGVANAISLVRAHLPLLDTTTGGWLGVLAMATDNIDGAVARRDGETPFGFYVDAFADAVFWTWFAMREETRPLPRAAAVAAWLVPVAAVSLTSFARGRMVDAPSPALLRPAMVLQGILTLRACRRHRRRCSASREDS